MSTLGTLHLIPTVIAPDTERYVLSEELIKLCNSLDLILAENIRTARRALAALPQKPAISEINFAELSKKTSRGEIENLLQPLFEGKSIGVMSEAGCPGIADPGARAVEFAHQHNIPVRPWVGASSIFLALMGSGFSGQQFAFSGYLPIDKNERVKAIKRLESNMMKNGQTQIFMETPYRNNQLLTDLLKTCKGNTMLCIASNISSHAEFIKSRTISTWKKDAPDLHKKPTIFLFGVSG